MTQKILVGISLIVALGVSGQLLAWHTRIPSIVVLLALGLLAGPVFGILDPEAILGEMFRPIISLSVALILFEGGLGLRLADVPRLRGLIIRLLSIGVLVTWALSTCAAIYLLGFDLPLAVLFGAILTISGPTVVVPLVRHVRPRAPVGEILKWEAILVDPIGALLSVLVFEALLLNDFFGTPLLVARGLILTSLSGGLFGFGGAALISTLFRRQIVPDHLENAFTLMVVVVVHVAANYCQPESGLFAVTLMAIVLANTQNLTLHHILDFKENLTLLVLSSLFIILAARVEEHELLKIALPSGISLLAFLIVIVRPIAVLLSALGSVLDIRARLFVSWLAPRGVVAAAVGSVFAYELIEHGYPSAELLVPYLFFVIMGSVLIYGLTSPIVGTLLGVSQISPEGLLFLGANTVSRAIAKTLHTEGFRVMLVDSNAANVAEAQILGLPTHHGNILHEGVIEVLNLDGIGRFLGMTPNHEANSLACLRFAELFGRSQVFQLPQDNLASEDLSTRYPRHLRGKLLFNSSAGYFALRECLRRGGQLKIVELSAEFPVLNQSLDMNSMPVPLFFITKDKRLRIITATAKISLKPGQKVICLYPSALLKKG